VKLGLAKSRNDSLNFLNYSTRSWCRMIISCSHCATSYEVDASYFEPDGRKVKCSSCSTVWFQENTPSHDVADVKPSQTERAVAPDEKNAPDTDTDTDTEASADIKSEAQRLVAAAQNKKATAQQRKKQFVSNVVGWSALAATIVLVAGLATQYRLNIVKALPGAAQLYAQLGMPVNVRGMSFANVVYKREFENGLPIIAIKGEVINLSDQQKVLPRVRFGLLDGTEKELYYWTVRVDKKPIGPNARVKFVTRLASPPAGAEGLVVRFARATSGYGAYR